MEKSQNYNGMGAIQKLQAEEMAQKEAAGDVIHSFDPAPSYLSSERLNRIRTVHMSDLPPHVHINLNGEITGKELALKAIAAGEAPELYTVSDEYIEASLFALSEDHKAGRQPSDYTGTDHHAKRILYFPLRYCPKCGVQYVGLKRQGGNQYCCSTNHHGTRIALLKFPHERVELVSSSYEDGGHFSGDKGKVIDARGEVSKSGQIEVDIRVAWDNGADECWIPAEDFVQA